MSEGSPARRSAGSTDASRLLRQALEGHYSGWQEKQEMKMARFIDETLERGPLANLHDPLVWGHNSMKFLTADDPPPAWMSEAEALDLLYQIAEQRLADLGVTNYHIDHGVRDFAGGKSFTFFRLCNSIDVSMQNWMTEQTSKTIDCVDDAVKVMLKAASQGDAHVWAKLPSGRYSNFLLKDDPIPVGLTREQAVNAITKIVCEVLDKHFDLPNVTVTTMGNVMTGTYFKLTYEIPRPEASPARRSTPSRTLRSPPSASRSPGGSSVRRKF